MDYHNESLLSLASPNVNTPIYKPGLMEPCFTWKRVEDQARQMNYSAIACAIVV